MHFRTDQLLAFLGENGNAVDLAKVREHLPLCDDCRAQFEELQAWYVNLSDRTLWAVRPLQTEPVELLGIVALSARAAAEDAAADDLVATLPADRVEAWKAACAAPAHRTAGLVRRLIREARARYARVPVDALTILDVAVEIAESLTPRTLHLEGELWKERGNAFRHLGHYPEALRALDKAERAYGKVPVAEFDRAFVLWARATVYWAMKHFDDARALASRAEETFREYHDEVHAAQVQLLEGGVRFDEGDIAGARTVFESVRPAVEQFEDEETLARLFANLCTCDIRLGNLSRGRVCGVRAAALFARLGMDTEALRLFWSVAEAMAAASNRDVALAQLRDTAAQFESIGMLGVAADVSLDTLRMLLDDGKYEEAARLSALLAARFRQENVAIDAAHAFAYFQEAAAALEATPALVDYLRYYLTARADGEDVRFAPTDGLPN
jgi:tetratricopeptide (TPR) repeat protein